MAIRKRDWLFHIGEYDEDNNVLVGGERTDLCSQCDVFLEGKETNYGIWYSIS